MEIVMANQGTAIALQDMLVQNAQENASLVFMGQNAMKVNVILKYINFLSGLTGLTSLKFFSRIHQNNCYGWRRWK